MLQGRALEYLCAAAPASSMKRGARVLKAVDHPTVTPQLAKVMTNGFRCKRYIAASADGPAVAFVQGAVVVAAQVMRMEVVILLAWGL